MGASESIGPADRAFALGAMLPDLMRLLAPRRAPPRADVDAALRSIGEVEVADGIAHHHHIDRWFHGCAVFTEAERALKERFFETKSKRLVLFAHPVVEMCLDGAWLARDAATGSPSTIFDASDRALLERVLKTFDEANLLAIDAHQRARVMGALENGLLYDDYKHAAGIARRTAGMRSSFGLPRPTADELAKWESAIAPTFTEAPAALVALEAERVTALEAERVTALEAERATSLEAERVTASEAKPSAAETA